MLTNPSKCLSFCIRMNWRAQMFLQSLFINHKHPTAVIPVGWQFIDSSTAATTTHKCDCVSVWLAAQADWFYNFPETLLIVSQKFHHFIYFLLLSENEWNFITRNLLLTLKHSVLFAPPGVNLHLFLTFHIFLLMFNIFVPPPNFAWQFIWMHHSVSDEAIRIQHLNSNCTAKYYPIEVKYQHNYCLIMSNDPWSGAVEYNKRKLRK